MSKKKRILVGWATDCDNLWKFQKAVRNNVKLYNFYHPSILFKQKGIETDNPIKVCITIEEINISKS